MNTTSSMKSSAPKIRVGSKEIFLKAALRRSQLVSSNKILDILGCEMHNDIDASFENKRIKRRFFNCLLG